MAKSTVRFTAELLIAVEKYLKLAERPTQLSAYRRLKRLEHAGPAEELYRLLCFVRASRNSGSFVRRFGG
jgi:hypothetical protein